MKRVASLAALVIVLLPGCHKHEDTTPVATPPSVEASNPPAASQGAPVPVPNTGPPPPMVNSKGAPDLDSLTMQLRSYVFSTGDKPRKWEDFVARSHIQPPPPPPGKKYAISPKMWIILVDE